MRLVIAACPPIRCCVACAYCSLSTSNSYVTASQRRTRRAWSFLLCVGASQRQIKRGVSRTDSTYVRTSEHILELECGRPDRSLSQPRSGFSILKFRSAERRLASRIIRSSDPIFRICVRPPPASVPTATADLAGWTENACTDDHHLGRTDERTGSEFQVSLPCSGRRDVCDVRQTEGTRPMKPCVIFLYNILLIAYILKARKR